MFQSLLMIIIGFFVCVGMIWCMIDTLTDWYMNFTEKFIISAVQFIIFGLGALMIIVAIVCGFLNKCD